MTIQTGTLIPWLKADGAGEGVRSAAGAIIVVTWGGVVTGAGALFNKLDVACSNIACDGISGAPGIGSVVKIPVALHSPEVLWLIALTCQ